MIHKSKGFTLVEIMIVVAIIGILIAIAIPSFFRARETSRARACQSNLVQIDGAAQQWATETNQAIDAAVVYETHLWGQDEVEDRYIRSEPQCPAGGDYGTGHDVDDLPECSLAEDEDRHAADGRFPHVHPSLIEEPEP